MNEVVFMVLCFAIISNLIVAHIAITANRRRERDQ